jgi:hypothetical protein
VANETNNYCSAAPPSDTAGSFLSASLASSPGSAMLYNVPCYHNYSPLSCYQVSSSQNYCLLLSVCFILKHPCKDVLTILILPKNSSPTCYRVRVRRDQPQRYSLGSISVVFEVFIHTNAGLILFEVMDDFVILNHHHALVFHSTLCNHAVDTGLLHNQINPITETS